MSEKLRFPNFLKNTSESIDTRRKFQSHSSDDPTHSAVNDMLDKFETMNFTKFFHNFIQFLQYLLKSSGLKDFEFKSIFKDKELNQISDTEAYATYDLFLSDKYANISDSHIIIYFRFLRKNKKVPWIATATTEYAPREFSRWVDFRQKTNSYEIKSKEKINDFLSECLMMLKIPASKNFKKYINLCNYLQNKVFDEELNIIPYNCAILLLLRYLQAEILNFKSDDSSNNNIQNSDIINSYDNLLDSCLKEFRYPLDKNGITMDSKYYKTVNLRFIQGILSDNGLLFTSIADFLNNFKKQDHFDLSIFKKYDFLKAEYSHEINESIDARRKVLNNKPAVENTGKDISDHLFFIRLFTKYSPELLNKENRDLNNPANCFLLFKGFLQKAISSNIKIKDLRVLEFHNFESKSISLHDADAIYKNLNDADFYDIYFQINNDQKLENEYNNVNSAWKIDFLCISFAYSKQTINEITIYSNFILNGDKENHIEPKFKFHMQKWTSPSEIISMLKWVIAVLENFSSNEFKAFLSTIEKINAYYDKFNAEHTNPQYDDLELPTFSDDIFKYFTDDLFSALGSSYLGNLHLQGSYKEKKKDLANKSGIFQNESSRKQYYNLVKLYNKELENMKTGKAGAMIDESIDARRKNAIQNADGKIPAEFLHSLQNENFTRKICNAFNENGKYYDFSKFNSARTSEAELQIFYKNFWNILKEWFRKKVPIHLKFMFLSTSFENRPNSSCRFIFDTHQEAEKLFDYESGPFTIDVSFEKGEIAIDIKRDVTKLGLDYSNIDGMVNSYSFKLMLSRLNNENRVDGIVLYNVLKNLKEILDYLQNPWFNNLMKLIESITRLNTCIIKYGTDSKLTETLFCYDDKNQYDFKLPDSQIQHYIGDSYTSHYITLKQMFGNEGEYKIFVKILRLVPFFALGEYYPKIKEFIETQQQNINQSPAIRFIFTMLNENGFTDRNGKIMTKITDFLKVTAENEVNINVDQPYNYEKAIKELTTSEKVYQDISDYKFLITMKPDFHKNSK